MAENVADVVEKYFRANRTKDLKLMRSILLVAALLITSLSKRPTRSTV